MNGFPRLMLVVALSLLLAACDPASFNTPIPTPTPGPPPRCDEIIHPALLFIPFEELAQSRETTEDWIITNFPTVTVEFQEPDKYVWLDRGKWYTLRLDAARPVLYYLAPPGGSRWRDGLLFPTIGDMLRCFGEPQYYSIGAVHGPDGYAVVLDILYTERGLSFTTIYGSYEAPRAFTSHTPLEDFSVFPPGTLEEIYSRLSAPEETIQGLLASYKEWPEEFTELVLNGNIHGLR